MGYIPAVITGLGQWMVNCAKSSGILSGKKIVYLPNMVDAEVLCPMEDRAYLRRKYGISDTKRVILFGVADAETGNRTKGFSFLAEALSELPREAYQLAVFGRAGNDMKLSAEFDATLLGFISEERKLAEIYILADVLVNPSN
ncbi:MAG: hypothetical protein NC337_02965 [Roseburia sp.]|nr:hypothetical protein [Roseburia sp.]